MKLIGYIKEWLKEKIYNGKQPFNSNVEGLSRVLNDGNNSIDSFLDLYKEITKAKLTTLRTYHTNIAVFVKHCHKNELDVDSMSSEWFNEWFKDQYGNKKQVSNKLRHTIFSSLFNHIATKGIKISPNKSNINIGVKDTSSKFTFTDDDIDIIYSHVKNYRDLDVPKYQGRKDKRYQKYRDSLILKLGCFGGLRRGEIVTLQWDSITIRGDVYVVKVLGKGVKIREIAINRSNMDKEIEYLKRNKRSDKYIFRGSKNRHLSCEALSALVISFFDTIKHELSNSDAIFTAHTMRHIYAVVMYRTIDIFDLSRLLGHSSIDTTQKYLKGLEFKPQDFTVQI